MSEGSDITSEPCRLGYEEHDGARYCHEHGGFVEHLGYLPDGSRTNLCDRNPRRLTRPAPRSTTP